MKLQHKAKSLPSLSRSLVHRSELWNGYINKSFPTGYLCTFRKQKKKMIVQERPKTSTLQVSVPSAPNQALYTRKYSSNLKHEQLLFSYLMARQILSYLLKDVSSHRWSLPQARRLLLIALQYSPQFFALYQQYHRLPCLCPPSTSVG